MGKFNFDHAQQGGVDKISLHGHIDEDSNFSAVPTGSSAQLVIDFNGVTAINSCGIREWIKWLKTIPTNKEVVYQNCPKIIVDQANMVAGFVPENGKIQSFYVPYYCDSTDSEKMILFTEGKEFNGESVNPPQGIVDDETGEEMEMDVIEAKYFKFLKG